MMSEDSPLGSGDPERPDPAEPTVADAPTPQAQAPDAPTPDPLSAEVLAAENEGMGEAVGQPHAEANPQAALWAAQLAAVEADRDALKDQMIRALAETDNVRKRANRQIADERVYAVEKFARDLLGVADNLARAVEQLPADQRAALPDAARALIEGVELTQKDLVAVLARHGVTAVDASPGATFDPAWHQAVTQVPSVHPAGTVAQTFQSGWKIGDRTLRAAMVAVSAGGGGSA
jgi:molecular chaperone GrpE